MTEIVTFGRVPYPGNDDVFTFMLLLISCHFLLELSVFVVYFISVWDHAFRFLSSCSQKRCSNSSNH